MTEQSHSPTGDDVVENLVVRLTELAIMELDADEENSLQINAWGDAAEKEIRAAIATLSPNGVSQSAVEQLIPPEEIGEEPALVGLGAHWPEMEYLGAAQYSMKCDCGFKAKPCSFYEAKHKWAKHVRAALAAQPAAEERIARISLDVGRLLAADPICGGRVSGGTVQAIAALATQPDTGLRGAADKLEAMQAALVFAYENGFRWPERFGINRAALNLNRERG